ncbi:hypothetical protein KSD_00580 [Ktedonobacter sp. SOSP1-85]|nr:hypothetical protein KSD_00580 [Ktedonobacter sp. SOSP1-85]
MTARNPTREALPEQSSVQAKQSEKDYPGERINVHFLQHRLGASIEPYTYSKGTTVRSDTPEAPERDKTHPHQEEPAQ